MACYDFRRYLEFVCRRLLGGGHIFHILGFTSRAGSGKMGLQQKSSAVDFVILPKNPSLLLY